MFLAVVGQQSRLDLWNVIDAAGRHQSFLLYQLLHVEILYLISFPLIISKC